MKKTFKTMIAVAALSGTVAANVQAEEVTIKKGDTLWDLSKTHQTSIEDLKDWNDLSSDLIIAGESLEVSPEIIHTVKEGESLWSVAKKYSVTVKEIIGWNTLQSDVIQPEQELIIYENARGQKAPSASTKTINAATIVPAKAAAAKPAKEKAAAPVKAPAPAPAPAQKTEAAVKEITVTATAYTASCEGCSGITATGVNLKENPDAKVISVDPNVIPLGSKVYVEGYGYATAADTGGSIKGNKIDIFIPSKEDAIEYGRKTVKVKILQ